MGKEGQLSLYTKNRIRWTIHNETKNIIYTLQEENIQMKYNKDKLQWNLQIR